MDQKSGAHRNSTSQYPVNLKDLCTVLVMGCDEYFDVLELNGVFREKFYPDCSFQYFCCTQTQKPQEGKYDQIILNDLSDVWTVRLHNALKEINTPYILLILDDFFFSQKVNEKRIAHYLRIMKENNVGVLNLIPGKGYTLCGANNEFGELEKENPFRIGFTVGIWKKEFLYNVTPEACSVWEAERKGIRESKKYNEKSWTVRKNTLAFVHAIMSGGWTIQALRFFRSQHLEKQKYKQRKNKPLYIYCKDIIYNILTTIAPESTMNMVQKLGIGRK